MGWYLLEFLTSGYVTGKAHYIYYIYILKYAPQKNIMERRRHFLFQQITRTGTHVMSSHFLFVCLDLIVISTSIILTLSLTPHFTLVHSKHIYRSAATPFRFLSPPPIHIGCAYRSHSNHIPLISVLDPIK